MIEIVQPHIKYRDSFLAAVKAHKSSGESDGMFDSHEYTWFEEHYEELVQKYLDEAEGKNLAEGRIASTQFWIIDGNQWVGRFSLRHKLNVKLREYGGHLGYYLIPSARGKGIGTWAMGEVLEEAKKLGIDHLLLTTDEQNIASQKLIRKFGGTHTKTIETEFNDGPLMHWWIDIPEETI